MSTSMQLAVAVGSVAVLLGLMGLVRKVASSSGLGAEVQRKLIHVCTGLYALTLPWLFPDRWPVYMLVGITVIVMIVLRLPEFARGIGATLHSVERRTYGDFLLALSIALCLFFSDGNLLLYVLPIAVLTLADAAAALAGTTYGTRIFRVEDSHKSVEGTVVFFVIALLIAIVCLMLMSSLPAPNILVLALMVAGFGTLVEAQSWRGFDNLFLPLGLLIFLDVQGNSGILDLTVVALLFLTAILSFHFLGQRIGMSTHAARVYAVAIFLVLAVTAVQNAVLPALVLVAHVWANQTTPGADRFDELDIVASLALISFGWLALGNATGWHAVAFYGLSAMGLAMGLFAIALRQRVAAVVLVAVLLLAAREAFTRMNPPGAQWAEPLLGLSILCVLVTGALPILIPQAFRQDRVMRLSVVALAPPLTYYLAAVWWSGVQVALEKASS